MAVIKFNKNWNRKLDGEYFTTFRLDGAHHRKGQVYDVQLNDTPLGRCICMDKKTLKLEQVNDWIAALDAGTDAKGFKEIVRVMYKNTVPDVNAADFCLLLMKKLK